MHPIEQLLKLMAALRDLETGCPWDKQQDFSSIVPYTIEEAYEVADAIERDAMDDLCNELGDLLFQVVYHSRMAEEKGLFAFNDVVTAISNKIKSRHPHVFADEVIETADEQSLAWEKHKHRERQADENSTSILDGIGLAMPALMRAQKLQHRAAIAGFDWPGPAPVMDKLHEELEELSNEIDQADDSTGNGTARGIHNEMGDLLFSCVNLSRHLDIDAEAALRSANRKFEQRFRYIEHNLSGRDGGLKKASLEEMEELWQLAKQQEI